MKIVLALMGMISFTVIANLLLKTGAVAGGTGQWHIMNILNWRVVLGLASFAVAVLFYFMLMHWLPLNVATSFAGAQYIAVVVAARLVLSEPIGEVQWVGIILIALGIAVVGWSRPG